MMLIMILTRPRSHVSCCDYNIDDFIQIFCANMCCVWWNTDNINIPAGLNVDAIFNVDNGLNIGFNVDTPSRPQMKLQMLRSPLCARVDGEIRGNTGKYGEMQARWGNTGRYREDGRKCVCSRRRRCSLTIPRLPVSPWQPNRLKQNKQQTFHSNWISLHLNSQTLTRSMQWYHREAKKCFLDNVPKGGGRGGGGNF